MCLCVMKPLAVFELPAPAPTLESCMERAEPEEALLAGGPPRHEGNAASQSRPSRDTFSAWYGGAPPESSFTHPLAEPWLVLSISPCVSLPYDGSETLISKPIVSKTPKRRGRILVHEPCLRRDAPRDILAPLRCSASSRLPRGAARWYRLCPSRLFCHLD